LVKLLQSGKLPKDREEGVLVLLAGIGGPKELEIVFDAALETNSNDKERTLRLMDALIVAARERKMNPSGDLNRLKKLSGLLFNLGSHQLSPYEYSYTIEAVQLAGLWKVETMRDVITEYAKDPPWSIGTLREAALDALAETGGPDSIRVIQEVANDRAADKTDVPVRSAPVPAARLPATYFRP
jgi:hypothetical protein